MRIDATYFATGEPERRTTTVEWQPTEGNHLFPRVVKYNGVISLGGAKYDHEEVITVVHANFHNPIDPTVFTLAGLGLNENQAIAFPGLKHEDCPLWRNGKVDYSFTVGKQMADTYQRMASDSGQPIAPIHPPAYPGRTNTPLLLGVLAALISVGAAVAAVVIRRRRTMA